GIAPPGTYHITASATLPAPNPTPQAWAWSINFQLKLCDADFNGVGGVTTQDIFDFLNAWFAGCHGQSTIACNGANADINGGGLGIQDVFDFLNAWFAGCE